MTDLSPRVNSARLAQYIGRTVRLPCRILESHSDTAVVEASDGGQVQVRVLRDAGITDTYVEIIGNVDNVGTLKMMACVNMGNNMDMKLVNDTIELSHDPRFQRLFF